MIFNIILWYLGLGFLTCAIFDKIIAAHSLLYAMFDTDEAKLHSTTAIKVLGTFHALKFWLFFTSSIVFFPIMCIYMSFLTILFSLRVNKQKEVNYNAFEEQCENLRKGMLATHIFLEKQKEQD